MGRNLLVRVSLVTYDEAAVRKSWPRLYSLVWPEATAGELGKDIRATFSSDSRGVMELAAQATECIRFGELAPEQKEALEPSAASLASLLEKMENALGDRDVQKAHALTYQMEDALDDAEKALARM